MDRHTDPDPGAGPDRPDRPKPPEDAAPAAAADQAALRGTRFEFGGRRPFSFPPPRVTYRGPQRTLPGLGTVALGKVTRVVPYGAFVDFLGYRGLVHISQLLPGQRVERVEDVVQMGVEVVVRVIAVDPERRHINLALVPETAAAAQETAREAPAAPTVLPEPPAMPAAPETAPPAPVIPAAPVAPVAPAPTVLAGSPPPVPPDRPAPPPAPRPRPPAAPRRGPVETVPPPLRPVTARPAPPAAPPEAPRRPAPRAAPKPAAAAQHGARAVHRELTNPAHPMARLLASAGDWSLRPERTPPPATGRPEAPGGPAPAGGGWPPDAGVAAAAAAAADDQRPVHVAEPEPEPEPSEPATLESLAARFGAPGGAGDGEKRPARSARDRSREARERQAAILARLRQGG
jgi:predicted RNA-binding protein with RPS1 domain